MRRTEEVVAAGGAGCASRAGSCPQGTSARTREACWVLSGVSNGLSSSSGERLRLELSNWIAGCLLLKGLCIPLSINLFMAHG